MMFKYLKQYNWADIRQIIDNDRAVQKVSTVSLTGRHCVLTGSTSGVGWEAAQVLASYGASLTLINRNRDKSEQTCALLQEKYGIHCRFLLADFSIPSEVHAAATTLLSMEEPIDVLINNAGMFSTRRQLTKENLEMVFCVNHLAPFILTETLMPKLRETPGARIIQVNSQGHRFNGLRLDDLNWSRRHYTGMRGYGASKTAQLLCTWEFADLLAGSGVTCNAMHPGAVSSAIGENNGRFYRWYKHHLIDKRLKDPHIAGLAIHYLATAPELDGISGQYFNLTMPETPAPHARDRELGSQIFSLSQEMSASTKTEMTKNRQIENQRFAQPEEIPEN